MSADTLTPMHLAIAACVLLGLWYTGVLGSLFGGKSKQAASPPSPALAAAIVAAEALAPQSAAAVLADFHAAVEVAGRVKAIEAETARLVGLAADRFHLHTAPAVAVAAPVVTIVADPKP